MQFYRTKMLCLSRAGLAGFFLSCVLSSCAPKPTPSDNQVICDGTELKRLLDVLDDDPDLLHTDRTPATKRLVQIGIPALKPVLRLMVSGGDLTRMHAQTVLWGVTGELFVPEKAYAPGDDPWEGHRRHEEWVAFLDELGDLRWDAPEEQRRKAVKLWEKWIDDGCPVRHPTSARTTPFRP